MKFLISYNDALDQVSDLINKSNKSVTDIAEETGIPFRQVSMIKTKYSTKKFPHVIEKLFKYFNINATKITAFEIEK